MEWSGGEVEEEDGQVYLKKKTPPKMVGDYIYIYIYMDGHMLFTACHGIITTCAGIP